MRSHGKQKRPQPQRSPCPCCGLPDTDSTCILNATPVERVPNSQVTREEVILAKQVVEEGQARIERLEEAIELLMAQHEIFHSVVADHMSFLSPINALPDDILWQIFLELRPDCGPWQVAVVCRRWRAAAISCSELWADLEYDYYGMGPEVGASQLAILLERSGSRPLRLSIRLPQHDARFDGPAHQPIVELIAANASRIRAISCEGSTNIFAEEVLDLLSLDTLIINNQGEIDEIGWLASDLPHRTPLLRRLELRHTELGETSSLSVPWSSLVELELCDINTNAAAILHILSQTSSLAKLVIAPPTWVQDELFIYSLHEVEVPRLRHLSVAFTVNDANSVSFHENTDDMYDDPTKQLPKLLQHLRAPRLEEMKLEDVTGEDLHAVCSFLEGSIPPLQVLHVKKLDLVTMASWATFIPLLAAVPTLEQFLLSFVNKPSEHVAGLETILAAMSLPIGIPREEDSPLLCPLLTTISFHALMLPFSALQSVIESRVCAPAAILKTLHLSDIQWHLSREDLEACEDHPDGEIIMHRWLEGMKERGLEYTKMKVTPRYLRCGERARGGK